MSELSNMGQLVLPLISVLLLLIIQKGAKFITIVSLIGMMFFARELTLTTALQGLISLLALNTVLMPKSKDYIAEHQVEYYILILLATIGADLMLASTDLITLFISLELMSFSLYALAGAQHQNKKAAESSLKYFLLGSFSSALLLYGIAWMYGLTHSLQFVALPQTSTISNFALVLFFSGFLFKLAIVPFHAWASDVYEGAPTPVSAFMATAVKVAALGVVLKLFSNYNVLVFVFICLGLLSLLIANLAALRQRNLKRLLAYSAISHAGFLILGCLGTDYTASVIYYLVIYVLNTASAFTIVYCARGDYDIENYYGLAKKRPIMAFILAANMLSLAGIPPLLGGVFAKFYLLNSLVKSGQIVLVICGIVAALIACIYYLRVVSALFLKSSEREVAPSYFATAFALFLTVVGIGLGIIPDTVYNFIATLK